jgi:putative ABC transport system permease protein
MKWLARLRSLMRNLFCRARVEQQLDDEVRSCLEMLASEKIQQGLTPEEAQRAARIDLGGVEQAKEEVRTVRAGAGLDTLLRDLRYGARMLRKNPGFTLVAVLTLALGVGANTATFSLVNGILLRPLPYAAPDRLVSLWQIGLPKGGLLALRAKSRTMEIAGYGWPTGYNLMGREEPVRLVGSRVTPSLFPLLDVNAQIGRVFRPEEELPGQSRVVVLSHPLWQRLYGQDLSVVGRSVTLEGTNYQVVGVMPADFRFPGGETDFWLPIQVDPGGKDLWGWFGYVPIARLRPGVGLAEARAEYRALIPQVVKLFPWPMPAHYAEWTEVSPLQTAMVAAVEAKLILLLGAVGLVLLIACANVANLLLTRTAARQKEIAVRLALGAGRARLVRQLLTECLLVAFAGGALGLLLAQGGLVVLRHVLPADTPRLAEAALDLRALAFTAGLAVATGLGFGLVPAWRASQTNMEETLRGSSQKAGLGRGRRRLSSTLVVTEAAVMVVLLIGAGLTLRSLWHLMHLRMGFRSDHVLTALITPNASLCNRGDQCVDFYRELLGLVGRLPGVESAAIADSVAFEGVAPLALAVEDRPEYSSASPFSAWSFTVSPGLVRTLGIPLLAGRDFTDADRRGAPGVVLVSRKFAERLWPGQNPLGRHVKPSWVKEWRTVVGVVADVRELALYPEGAWRVTGDIYFPAAQGVIAPLSDARLVARTAGDPGAVAASLRAVVDGLRNDVAVSRIRTMEEILSLSVSAPRSTTSLFVLFAMLALALGAMGIYSVASYSVAERTHEIGIRMAMGAQQSNVLRLVVGQGMELVCAGIALGLACAAGLTRFMQSLLYGVRPCDPLTYAGVSLMLVLVALASCFIPAQRALRVDPMIALRYE